MKFYFHSYYLNYFTGKAAEVQNVNQDVRQRSNDTVESSRQKLPSKPQKKQNTGSPGILLLDLLEHIESCKNSIMEILVNFEFRNRQVTLNFI